MEEQKTKPVFAEVVDIQFRPGQKVYYFDPAGITCKPGMHVIIDTARGPEYGYCTAGNHRISASEVVSPLRPVLRIATERDEQIARENQLKEKKAFEVCAQKIEEYKLDMQLVSAECAFDGSKLLFFFTAEERVDFRELVKVLANHFHIRIELRQIGVRDKAKMLGGLGICGRPFCCATFLDDFQPVSIKMAKTQNLSLNPTKISGTCGRLMCCLKYEQDAYEDLLRRSPKADSFVDTPDGRGTVIEVDLLRQRVKVRMENQETTGTYANEDIAVFRNGKAKKNDPPIPDDWAPISGSGRCRKKEQPDEELPVMLDSIRMRYSTETIAEEQMIQEEEPAPEEGEAKQARNRRRRRPRGKSQQTEGAPSEKPAQPKKEQPKKEQTQKEQPKKEQPEQPAVENKDGQKKRRRPPYRRRNKSGGGEKAE